MTTISDERLAEMLAGLEGVPPGPWVPGYYEDGDPDSGPNGEFYPDGSILSVHDDGSCEHVDPWQEVVAKHFARCDPDTMRSIITELQSLRAQGGVRVKPLEWHKSHMPSWNDDWHTTTPFIYSIRCADEKGWKWSAHGGCGYAPTPSEAKAAAQADYERRILSSLEASPAPVSEREALIDYLLQDASRNRLTPRVVDIAYTAYTLAKQPNKEDGGPSDWFTDTKPTVDKMIGEVRAALAAKGGQ